MSEVRTQWEFHVTNSRTGQSVEKHYSMTAADAACKVCNDHERRNGREPIYTVVPLEPRK